MVNLVFAGDSIASAYEARIIAAGGTLSFTHLAAVRAFIATGKAEGWWDKIVECCPFLGSNLAAALVKLKFGSGSGTSIIAHDGLTVDIQYTPEKGVFVEGNAGPVPFAYLSTGVIPSAQGLTATNFSFGGGSILTDDSLGTTGSIGGWGGNAWIGADNPNPAINSPFGATPTVQFYGFGWNRSYNAAMSFGVANANGATDGIGNIDGTPAAMGLSPGPMDQEFNIFRAINQGTTYPTINGSVGFFFVGSYLTPAETRAVTAAARQMHVSARQIVVGTHDVFIGDSITVGQGSVNGGWAERVMDARRLTEPHYQGTNVAQAGITTISAGFPYRYTGTGAYPVTIYFTKMGANDCSLLASPATYKQALVDMANTLKALNTLTVIVTISFQDFVRANPAVWTEATAHAHMMQYVTAALEAADEAGVLGVDAYTPMLADPDPGLTYLVDFVHLSSAGAQLVADTVIDAYAAYRASL